MFFRRFGFQLLMLAGVLVISPIQFLHAASDIDMGVCLALENDLDRLACYDAVARSTQDQSSTQANAPVRAVEQAISTPDRPPTPPQTQTQEAPAISAQKSTPPALAARTERNRDAEFGAETITKPRKRAGSNSTDEADNGPRLKARVTRTSKSKITRYHTLYMDNNQVWRQVGNANVYVPRGSFEIEILPGTLGSYWLVMTGRKGQKMRVKRVR